MGRDAIALEMARRLRDARRAKGLTQQQLATKVGVVQGSIGNYEAGLARISRDTAIAISKQLGIDPAHLLCLDVG